ncbi:hypothetical protein [Xanthomonas bundabergensis]|uniref:hypothetical protein n=1 Tax=Xanthomonas bundabergensis TaxID=3160842 RepID=UPI00351925FB
MFLRVDPTGLAEKNTTFLHVRSNDPWIHVDGADRLQFMIGQRQVAVNILSLSRLK